MPDGRIRMGMIFCEFVKCDLLQEL
jgi:hypothetical protein